MRTGYVIAAHKIELASKSRGRVAWIGVEKGDKVRQGRCCASEDDEYKAQVATGEGWTTAVGQRDWQRLSRDRVRKRSARQCRCRASQSRLE